MKKLLLLIILFFAEKSLQAQYVYTIKADSVKITNSCDTAELIIENHTQNVPGFLFNKGAGRTEFRKGALKLNDSMYLIGADTLRTNGPRENFIWNQTASAQAAGYWINGLARVNNKMIIEVPDTTANRHPWSYTHYPAMPGLRLGTTDASLSSINTNALISLGRHYGAGIMLYDNLDTKVDCYGIGVTSAALQCYAGSAWNPGYFTWNVGGYQPVTGTNEIMRLKNNGNLMIGTTTDEGYRLHVNGTVKISSLPFTNNRDTVLTYDPSTNQLKATTVSPCKKYVALLSQSGTNAPTATILENTLGGTITWSRNASGNYTATLIGAFTQNRTWFNTEPSDQAGNVATTKLMWSNANTVTLIVKDGSQANMDGWTNLSVEIRVYP
jgi:hypothetical protein